MAPGNKQFTWLAITTGVILLGLLLLLPPDRTWSESVSLFLIVGTVFGQTSLAAAWFVLGPFSLAKRLPLSAAWVAAIVLLFGWDLGGAPAPRELDLLLTFAALVPLQWSLVATPMAVAAGCFGLRFESHTDRAATGRHQIGIREALVLTGVVAIVLGGARYRAGDLSRASILWEYVFVYASLVVWKAVFALLLFAVILPKRGRFRKFIYSILATAAICILEFCFLYYAVPSFSIPLDAFWPVIVINFSQALWIIVVPVFLTLGGFCLTSSRTRRLSQISDKSGGKQHFPQ